MNDRLSYIKARLTRWKNRPSYEGNMAAGFDRIAAWSLSSESDIEWLIEEVEELRKKVRTLEVVKH